MDIAREKRRTVTKNPQAEFHGPTHSLIVLYGLQTELVHFLKKTYTHFFDGGLGFRREELPCGRKQRIFDNFGEFSLSKATSSVHIHLYRMSYKTIQDAVDLVFGGVTAHTRHPFKGLFVQVCQPLHFLSGVEQRLLRQTYCELRFSWRIFLQ